MTDINAVRAGIARRHGRALLLIVASILFTVAAVDATVYFVLNIKNPGHDPGRFFEFSPLLGWFHKPGAEGYWYRYPDGTKYYVRINEFGFSDSSRTIEKTRPRIALIGDSTTEYWEADEKDRGQYVIESLLQGDYEVLNFGVRAHGTDQIYLLLKEIGLHFAPDVVIYTFCINDINDNDSHSSKPYFVLDPDGEEGLALTGYPIRFDASLGRMDAGSGLEHYPFVYRTLRPALPRLLSWLGHLVHLPLGGHGNPVPLEFQFELRPYKRDYDADDRRRMEVTERIIARLDALSRAHGMKFLLVGGIYKPELDASMQHELAATYGDLFDFSKVSTLLERYASAQGIPFLSLPRTAQAQGLNVDALMDHSDNIHLNAEGIRFYARAVVEKLEALHWVGDKGTSAGGLVRSEK